MMHSQLVFCKKCWVQCLAHCVSEEYFFLIQQSFKPNVPMFLPMNFIRKIIEFVENWIHYV